jgi:hypothetical protein
MSSNSSILNNLFWLAIIGFSLLLNSCAPPFSEMQSARLVGEKKLEILPSYSYVYYNVDGDHGGIQNHGGLQLAYGYSEKTDIRLRYEQIWITNDSLKNFTAILGGGPKFSVLKNYIAFYAPIGRALKKDNNTSWKFYPTFLFTLPLFNDKLDITFSPKYMISFCKDCNNLLALNLGLSLGKDVKKWSLRPEYGILFQPGESGHYGQFSLAFSAILGK